MGKTVKQLIGQKAVHTFVHSGMKLGLGTGSTALWAVHEVCRMIVHNELQNMTLVASSLQAENICNQYKIRVDMMNNPEIGQLDLYIDGADRIDNSWYLIKGGGAAHTREKILAYNSKDFVIVADTSKMCAQLGIDFPVPLEVLPHASSVVMQALHAYGYHAEVREAVKKCGPVITDNGNIIIDVFIASGISDVIQLEKQFNAIVGVVENGLFTRAVTAVIIGDISDSSCPIEVQFAS